MTTPEGPLATPLLPAAWGEVFDKLSILEIKCDRLSGEAALANVRHERQILAAAAAPALAACPELAEHQARLARVNGTLWDVEDRLRECEAAGRFDAGFVELARSVYRLNDERAAIKRAINALLRSEIVEEKSYSAWR